MSFLKASFHGQHPDEVVVILQRRHWLVLAGRTVRWLVLGLVPGILQLVIGHFSDTFTFDPSTTMGALLTLGGSAYLIVILTLGFSDWVDYELDALIVTNERVLRIEQSGMFNRTVSQLTLDRIQDVTTETKGMLSTMLGFGKVTIETAGEQEHFTFDHMPNVESIQAQILQYVRKAPRMGVERNPADVKTPPASTSTPQ